MYLISAEGYKNAGVHLLRVRKTGQIWVSMKNVHNGYTLKNVRFNFERNTWQVWNKKPHKRVY